MKLLFRGLPGPRQNLILLLLWPSQVYSYDPWDSESFRAVCEIGFRGERA
jgi:hypothetical protein